MNDFYEHTKNSLMLIETLEEEKNKSIKPSKVIIKNPNNKKLLAVFDLDETLIHADMDIKDKDQKNIVNIKLPSSAVIKVYINVRPYWKEALEIIKENYCICIYTASHSSYADAILDFLDPDKEYFYSKF